MITISLASDDLSLIISVLTLNVVKSKDVFDESEMTVEPLTSPRVSP